SRAHEGCNTIHGQILWPPDGKVLVGHHQVGVAAIGERAVGHDAVVLPRLLEHWLHFRQDSTITPTVTLSSARCQLVDLGAAEVAPARLEVAGRQGSILMLSSSENAALEGVGFKAARRWSDKTMAGGKVTRIAASDEKDEAR
ncbi:tRNA 5-methylaminomethyl-2-thiouridinebiosynthesis bifunctional protein MnmC, partial [Striga asiatica]